MVVCCSLAFWRFVWFDIMLAMLAVCGLFCFCLCLRVGGLLCVRFATSLSGLLRVSLHWFPA